MLFAMDMAETWCLPKNCGQSMVVVVVVVMVVLVGGDLTYQEEPFWEVSVELGEELGHIFLSSLEVS